LVETHGLHHLGDLLGVGEVGYLGKRVKKNLYLSQITHEEALEEYVLQQVRFRFVYNAVFKNRYVKHFIDAAPGLGELLTIGKIWSLVGEGKKWGKKKVYDVVIVDAPSTGHGLSLLTVPQIVASAVRVGPLKTKSEKILSLLQDPKKCVIWLTTLPEEMPVNEAVEMAEKLKNEAKMELGPLLVNALWPSILKDESRDALKHYPQKFPLIEVYEKRLALSRFYLDKIKTLLPEQKLIELPLVYETANSLEIAEALSEIIGMSLSRKK